MKQQIIWKRIDLAGQLCALMLPVFLAPEDHFFGRGMSVFFVTLFTVGGWQVLSAIIHSIAFKKQYWRGGRRAYNISLLILLGLAIALTVTRSEAMLVGLMAMWVIGPIMAVWYFAGCVTELNNLANLKRKMADDAFTDFPTLEQNPPIE